MDMKHSVWIWIFMASVLPSAAFASSPPAWIESQDEMTLECVRNSELRNPEPVGDIVGFDDRAGYSVLLMQGQYPQKHMRGQTGRELCLYNRRDKMAYVTEADALTRKGK
ncbi:hypothetical protein ACV22Y_27850 [Burkholderia sp. AW50-3]